MKQIFTLALTCFSMAGLFAQQSCLTATAITPGTYQAYLLPATEVPSPICTNGINNNPNRAVWYKYTPALNQTVTVTSDVSGYPIVDTRLHIYTGTCGNLTCVAGDDDGGTGNSSLVTFTANASVTYYIVFDNNWSSVNFAFSLTQAAQNTTLFTSQSIGAGGNYAVVDLNGDYLDDIVTSAGTGSVGILYQNAGTGFTSANVPATGVSNTPGWSCAAGDYNKDGRNDIMYGGGSGASVLLSNAAGTSYTAFNSPQYIFSQRTNFVDINNDGNLDAFVCHDVAPNCYFLNNGSGGFTFHQGGLGDHPSGGNYGSIWVDYDNDGDSDLFIAKCRGGSDPAAIDELHRNNGDGTFTNVAATAGFADYHQSWSSAWADYDNDGDMDVLVGASSNVAGGHKLMRNNGDGTFTNITVGSGYDTFTAMNIEHVAHDFNNDGFVDILSGNGKLMVNNGNMTFTPVTISATNGPVGDLNHDGFLDIQNGNTVYFNTGNTNKWIKIQLQGVESNRNGIGARVEIYGPWGKQIRDVKSGDGFRYMSSLNTHFGIGQAAAITQVIVKWPSGTIDVINNPTINQPLTVVEGATLALPEVVDSNVKIYPNPAKDRILVSGQNSENFTKANIFDLNGRLVKSSAMQNGILNVQGLSGGTYILVLEDHTGLQHKSKFIKE